MAMFTSSRDPLLVPASLLPPLTPHAHASGLKEGAAPSHLPTAGKYNPRLTPKYSPPTSTNPPLGAPLPGAYDSPSNPYSSAYTSRARGPASSSSFIAHMPPSHGSTFRPYTPPPGHPHDGAAESFLNTEYTTLTHPAHTAAQPPPLSLHATPSYQPSSHYLELRTVRQRHRSDIPPEPDFDFELDPRLGLGLGFDVEATPYPSCRAQVLARMRDRPSRLDDPEYVHVHPEFELPLESDADIAAASASRSVWARSAERLERLFRHVTAPVRVDRRVEGQRKRSRLMSPKTRNRYRRRGTKGGDLTSSGEDQDGEADAVMSYTSLLGWVTVGMLLSLFLLVMTTYFDTAAALASARQGGGGGGGGGRWGGIGGAIDIGSGGGGADGGRRLRIGKGIGLGGWSWSWSATSTSGMAGDGTRSWRGAYAASGVARESEVINHQIGKLRGIWAD